MSITLPADEVRIADLPELPARTLEAVVVHARHVPSRERAAWAGALEAVAHEPGVIVLRTCHRVELYLATDARPAGLPEPPRGAERHTDAAAARHLIAVACGLESAVLGEDQVMHQIRETHADRRAAGPLDPALDRLFQTALRAGRRAHAWFGPERRSLADTALDAIEAQSGALDGRRLLVVGAGSMGVLAAKGAVRHGMRVSVTNRTASKAEMLAHETFGDVVPWAEPGAVRGVAGVVVAVSGEWPISPADADALVASGTPVVDLSSPPATPEALQERLGELFHSVDELAWGSDGAVDPDLRDRLDTWVSECGRDYCRWLRARGSQPTIAGLTAAAEARRHEEIDWLLRRLPHLGEQERDAIEQMTHRLVAGILHGPRSALRDDGDGELDRAARTLFGLEGC